MQRMINKCDERRIKQKKYNLQNNIKPKAINKEIQESLRKIYKKSTETVEQVVSDSETEFNINEAIFNLEKDMLDAAEKLEFERAAALRDKLKKMKETYD